MAYPMTQLGGRAFNHGPSADAEQEYDRLRSLARHEHDLRSSCLDKAHNAYASGDGASAHHYSEEAKRHGAAMDAYNRQASEYIFLANNGGGRVEPDTIDLHGQYVEEAEEILERRIRTARAEGQRHLHVIVGKGNHSAGHVQKLKPAVERICREQGLQFATEENAGRIYVDLTGGPAVMPGYGQQGYGQGQGQFYGDAGYSQQQHGPSQGQGQGQYYPPPAANGAGYPGQQQGQYSGAGYHAQNHGQANDQNAEIEAAVKKYLPRILRKLERACCVVM